MLSGKTILVTGAAQRIGRSIALALAYAGAEIIIHYNKSISAATSLKDQIQALGRPAHLLPADLAKSTGLLTLIEKATEINPLFALINNASIFEPLTWKTVSFDDWNRHLAINLTAPFFLSQSFATMYTSTEVGRIVNLLDWRLFHPGTDHLPYIISKSALAALTRSLALSLAPRITVNGLALGAILPPSDGNLDNLIVESIPAKRWGSLDEVNEAILFLLTGPAYITGEMIHLDGGRNLT